MSNRIFFMGELALDITVGADGRAICGISDPIVNAALLTAHDSATAFIGEASADLTGNLIADTLAGGGVDLAAVDRITEGQSPVTVHSADGASAPVSYAPVPAEDFNPVWPRINPGDIMVWGSYFSLDKRVHAQMLEILRYARARKATMLYVPYFHPWQVSRITRVMPEVFDNFELADAVFAPAEIMRQLFGSEDMDAVYRNNLNFYTSLFFFCADVANHAVSRYSGDEVTVVETREQLPGMLAGVVKSLSNAPIELKR